jgi:opacity protein-like surface antigen
MRRAIAVAVSLALAAVMAFPASGAAYSPDAKCQGFMLSQWTLEVDPGTFAAGVYTHWMKSVGPANEGADVVYYGPGTFTVSDDVAVVKGNILIYNGVTIHPDQDGYFWGAFIWDMTGEYMGLGPHTMAQVHEQLAASAFYISVTPGTSQERPTEWTLMRGGPPASLCANLWGMSWLRRTYP